MITVVKVFRACERSCHCHCLEMSIV